MANEKELKDEKELTYEEKEQLENEEYEKALKDFSERVMVTELPSNMGDATFTKYVKKVLGIDCVLALINHEANVITPFHDDFEAPYDPITMWAIAVKNSIALASVNREASKPDKNMYVIMSHSNRAIVCCDEFWNNLCEELGVMRLIISMYHRENDRTFLIASGLDNDDKMDMRTYLNQANKEDESRISYVFVRNVGMLSEAALNSEM